MTNTLTNTMTNTYVVIFLSVSIFGRGYSRYHNFEFTDRTEPNRTELNMVSTCQYGDSFYLSLRRIKYEDNGSIIASKWFRAMSLGSYKMIIKDRITTEEVVKLGALANFSSHISLSRAGNYEIYIELN